MRKKISLLLSLIIAFASSAYATDSKVYVLPINDEIGSMTWQHTKRACEEAKSINAEVMLVHLNTYGGTLQHADSIRTALLNYPGTTIAFIDNNAASAGALIAIACDSIYMQKGASMGAATVVNQNAEAMPDKYQSYMRSIMRSTAESHGKKINPTDSTETWHRDPLIAEAMVDSRIVVPGLIDSTKVLTFTTSEAIKWGYCEGEASSIDEVLKQANIARPTISTFEPNFTDWLIGFFSNPAVQAILVMFIVGGIYFELQSPGLGFPTIAAIVSAVLYFLPLYITGIAARWIISLFVIGLILVLLEIFVIPGTGITGILGGVAIFIALVGGLADSFSGHSLTIGDLWEAILIVSIGLVMGIVLIFYLTSRHGPKFITRHSELQHSQRVEEGYIGVASSLSKHIGATAIATTDMRPGGKIEIGNETYDAVALKGNFIAAGTTVIVEKFENSQLYVTIKK